MPGEEPKGGGSGRFEVLGRRGPAKCLSGHSRMPGESQNAGGFLVTQEFSSSTHYKSCKESLDHNICCAAKRLKLVASFPTPRSFVERASCGGALRVSEIKNCAGDLFFCSNPDRLGRDSRALTA